LWNDKLTNGPDDLGYFAKFVPPTVANGKVYVASFGPVKSPLGTGGLIVYGLIPANANKLILNPIADVYVSGGNNANLNYSTDTRLQVDGSPGNDLRISFLKFDLAGVTNAITNATLQLYGSDANTTVSVYAVSDTNWTELGLTYNNMPALGADLDTITVNSTLGYYNWDVTSYLQNQQKAGNSLVTLAIATTNKPLANFQSRRDDQYPPQLVITTDIGGPSYAYGFGNGVGLTFNGSAALQGRLLQLTNNAVFEASSVFYTVPVNIASFHTTFQFQLTTSNAEGFTFTIQGVGPNALGGTGAGLGYGPDPTGGDLAAIGNSAAVKFDLYNSAGEGPDSTGLFTNGATPTLPDVNLVGSGIDLHSGHIFQVVLQYDGITLTETLTDTITSASFTQTYPVNLPALVGGSSAYVGFTASTGLATAVQQILSWTFGN
jgi:hypothetical protein